MPYKLLIASASAGVGHARAASALQRAFELSGREGTACTVDTLDFTTAAFRKAYLGSYFFIIRSLPWYWRRLYHRWDRKESGGLMRRATCEFDRLNARRFIRFVEAEQPTHVLCTHFLPAELLAWMRRTGRLQAPLAIAITDYDAHRIWINAGTDRYFVASDRLNGLLAEKGAPPDRIATSGIPIDPVFSAPMDRTLARAELGLCPDAPTVLVSGGGTGRGHVLKTVALLAESPRVQILAVAGHNEALRQQLEALDVRAPRRLITYGFVNYMHTLMAAADLIVTKPGGLSSAECLAIGLPMVLTAPIPGQEEANADFLVRAGAAVKVETPDEVRRVATALLADGVRLARMKEAALRTARPRAACEIIDMFLGPGRCAAGVDSRRRSE